MAKRDKKNLGPLDRFIRVILAIALAYIAYTYVQGFWMWALYVVAVILIFTALRARCLPYDWFGINTNK
ncbi:DUF2892 domain-containing protein [Candidatus Pacearchaeota archaeon]|nr:DUF2892 domain-containing protein [Candidatus Pacearchaeota archaeon]